MHPTACYDLMQGPSRRHAPPSRARRAGAPPAKPAPRESAVRTACVNVPSDCRPPGAHRLATARG